MNKVHLDNILRQYIKKYDEMNDVNVNDEGYKWRAEMCFKANWNIDAIDFRTMFKNSFKEMANLIDNSTVQPVGGILMLLNHEEEIEFVRKCFQKLFIEDNGNVDFRQKRIEDFIVMINSRIEKYAKGSWRYPQHRNAVIYYLNLWRPEENYIFKATEATEWANCIEFGDDFGSGNTFKLSRYYKMCDELLEELKKNKTIMALYHERMKNIDSFDDKGHILVYDVIYCAKAYNLYQNIPTLKKLSTKQRIKLAKTAEKKETLLKQIKDFSLELERLSANIVLPNIIGEKCTHKKWGNGTIIACEDNIIKVDFGDTVRKLQYPESINQFIVLEKKNYKETFDEYLINKKRMQCIKEKLNNTKRELKLYINERGQDEIPDD